MVRGRVGGVLSFRYGDLRKQIQVVRLSDKPLGILWALTSNYFFFRVILFHVYECFVYIYWCQNDQKKILGPLKSQLQTTVSHHVGARN